jgi:BirA family biotin operon repressor/biotin-[acetyl-CoA-carboxylase] ligase
MNAKRLDYALDDLPIGPLRYFKSVGSTNDVAIHWADEGAPDLALVVAEEQTAGRGRAGRTWFTPPNAALAFSIILRPPFPEQLETQALSARLTGLGALAVSHALRQDYQLDAKIKWPNDVLLDGRKVAGVLVEAHWQGDQLVAVILGIGVNVHFESVPPETDLVYPATCLQAILECAPSRPMLLHAILAHLLAWRAILGEDAFLDAWGDNLAHLGEWVQILNTGVGAGLQTTGQVIGLDNSGRLKLRDRDNTLIVLNGDDIHLRPLEGHTRSKK